MRACVAAGLAAAAAACITSALFLRGFHAAPHPGTSVPVTLLAFAGVVTIAIAVAVAWPGHSSEKGAGHDHRADVGP